MVINGMTRGGAVLVLACLGSLFAAPVRAQDLPVFDAHIHYSRPDWSVYSPDAILALLDKTGVRWAFVSSTPDDGTVRLHDKAPDRIVPVLRPYRTRADMGTWTTDASIVSYVRERLQRPIYKGLGEFHLSASQAADPTVKELVTLGARHGLFLYAHTDAAGIEELLRLYPQVRWLWAHAGLGEPFEAVGARLAQDLDVHEVGADLDVVAGLGQEVELVALLDASRRQRGEVGVAGSETQAEGAPFPAWDDRGHWMAP